MNYRLVNDIKNFQQNDKSLLWCGGPQINRVMHKVTICLTLNYIFCKTYQILATIF